jgi:hypothetical protein
VTVASGTEISLSKTPSPLKPHRSLWSHPIVLAFPSSGVDMKSENNLQMNAMLCYPRNTIYRNPIIYKSQLSFHQMLHSAFEPQTNKSSSNQKGKNLSRLDTCLQTLLDWSSLTAELSVYNQFGGRYTGGEGKKTEGREGKKQEEEEKREEWESPFKVVV